MANKKNTSVKNSHKIALGVGDLGYNLVSNTMSSFIVYFGNAVMGVPGTLMGLAVAIGTMWDAVTDPIVGFISDNSKNKFFGRRHLFIILGIILMSVVNIFLWSVPKDLNKIYKFLWFTIGIVVLETCHTLYATPNSALSIEITNDYNERSSIQGVKSIFMIIGMLLPTVCMGLFQKPTLDYPDGRFNPQSYFNFALIASSLALIFGLYQFIVTFSHIPRLRSLANKEEGEIKTKPKMKEIFVNFFTTLKNVNFRSVVIGYSVSMMAATFLISVGMHVFTFTFKTTTIQMYIMMASLFLMTMFGQPLWLYLSRKTNKKTTMIIGLCVSFIGCFMLLGMFLLKDQVNILLQKGTFYCLLATPPLLVAGLGTGVLYSMPLALVGDAILIDKAETKKERTGTYTGFMTLAYKGSQALSQLIIGSMLDIIGFKEGSSVQTPQIESALGWLLCIGVIISIGLGILIFSSYKITKKDVEKAIIELGIENDTN